MPPSPRITLRVPADLLGQLAKRCQAEGRSTTDVALTALRCYLSDTEIQNLVSAIETSDRPLTTNEQRMVAAVQAGIPLSVVVWEPEREPEPPRPLTETQQRDLELTLQLFAEQGIDVSVGSAS